MLPCRNLGFIGYKVVIQVTGDEPGGGGLLANNVNDIPAVKPALLAQEGLFIVNVVEPVVEELVGVAAVGIPGYGVGDSLASEGLRAGFHVILSVVGMAIHAHSHAEQLQ